MKPAGVLTVLTSMLLLMRLAVGEDAAPENSSFGLKFTLAEAERYAIQNHPRIASSQLTADAVRQEIREARSAFFPQIYGESTSVYAPYNNQKAEATRASALGGLNNPTIYSRQSDGIVVNQLLTDFGHTYDLTQSAHFRADAAADRVNAVVAVIVLEVDRAYFDLLQARAVLRVAQETVKTRQTAFDQVAVLVKNQLRSRLDQSFDQVALSQAKLLLIQAKGGVREAEAELSDALGFADAQQFSLVDEPLNLVLPVDADGLIASALQQRPDLAALRSDAMGARRFADAQRAEQYPKVTALAAAGINPEANDKLLNHNYYAAGINVEVPIANGGNLDAKADEARFMQRAADANVIDTQNAISRDVRVALLNLETAKERLDVTAELIQSSAEAQKLANARYRLGTSSIVEFNEAQLNYTQAALEDAQARYDFQIDRALLDFALGVHH
jgi:outer membrane protein